MFLGSMHTLEHFRDWVFMSPLFRSQAYVTWGEAGLSDRRPGGDDGVEALLDDYETRASTTRSTRSCSEYMAPARQRDADV